MVFSSLIFLFAFLPITLIVYSAVPNLKIKNIILAIASLVFYAVGEPVAVALMLGSVVVNYLLALVIGRKGAKRGVLALSVALNLLMMFVFKYLNFTTGILSRFISSVHQTHLLLPVGISFFTFQIMSYVIDVYKDPKSAQKSFLNVLLYISFFPQLIAGPIVKYHDISAQIANRRQTLPSTVWGIKRFCLGLAKKVLVADTVAVFVDYAFALDDASLSSLGTPALILTAVGYTLQIYFDFSGYSDMAIGMAAMFGFKLKENFNYPYVSSSVKEFWRRWHISLSSWFRDYVYIPLGGNRKGEKRTMLNKFTVFLLTGIWHGANFTFIVWGLLHGIMLVAEDKIKKNGKKPMRIFGHIYTLLFVCLTFVIFRANSLHQAGVFFKGMVTGFTAFTAHSAEFFGYFTPLTIITLAAGLIFSAPLARRVRDKMKKRFGFSAVNAVECIICLALLVLSAVMLISNGYSPNIYNQF